MSKVKVTNMKMCVSSANGNSSGDMCLLFNSEKP